MAYTTIDNPELYFQTKTYTGTGSSNSITLDGSENMQPDWVWFKGRNQVYHHYLFDAVRGANKPIHSSLTNAESTQTDTLMSFDSDGFTLGSDANNGEINSNGNTFVSWNWKAGTSFTNDASATGVGTIDSTGSVNDTAGFSICTHTGTGSNATIKHGLSTAPKMIITKKRSATGGWQVGHESIGWGNGIYLNTTDASTGDAGAWNSTAPTSSIFYVGNSSFTNQSSATYVSYIFSEKKGYSKFGKYIGNGNADGTFVYTGFLPAFVLLKRTDSDNWWHIFDNKRDAFNLTDTVLYPNKNNAESTIILGDMLSNGFKLRQTDADVNLSGSPYIYMAFAKSPFVNSNGIPNNSR
jgi:hypothetical protein